MRPVRDLALSPQRGHIPGLSYIISSVLHLHYTWPALLSTTGRCCPITKSDEPTGPLSGSGTIALRYTPPQPFALELGLFLDKMQDRN